MESNGGSGEVPARCVGATAIAWQSVSGLDPVLFTLLSGVFCCSAIVAKGPAWQRPSWCGDIHFLHPLSTLGHTEVFDVYKSVECRWVLRYCFDYVAVFEWCGVIV